MQDIHRHPLHFFCSVKLCFTIFLKDINLLSISFIGMSSVSISISPLFSFFETNLVIVRHYFLCLVFQIVNLTRMFYCKFLLFLIRARLHETRSELTPVWDFTLVWSNFIVSVHMTSGVVKFTTVQISLRSNWPKCNFKPQWDFHVNSKCPQRYTDAQNH